MIEGADYVVRVIDFPSYTLGGVVTPNDDGTYSVYINARLDKKHQRRAFVHELRHIQRNDFDDKPIDEVERL